MTKDLRTNGLYRKYSSGNYNRRVMRFAFSDDQTQRRGDEPKGTTLAAEKQPVEIPPVLPRDKTRLCFSSHLVRGHYGKSARRFCEVKRTQMTVLWYPRRFVTVQ